MEVPRRVVEEAVALMKQQRGNQALDIVRNYDITTFAQLERWCNYYAIPTWRQETGTRADESRPESEE